MMLLACQSLHAAEAKPTTFVDTWREYRMAEAGKSCEFRAAGYYMGVVSGLVGLANGLLFAIPQTVTDKELCNVVGKWIDEHPERWGDAKDTIVTKALEEAFPLSPKW